MQVTETRTDSRAAIVLDALMAHRGWQASDVQRASSRRGSGHPDRIASYRTVYRVLSQHKIPSRPSQFEIAATFGLLPTHIWGTVALPEPYAYLNEMLAVVA